MELAVHIRNPQHAHTLNDLPGHLSAFYVGQVFKELDGFLRADQGSLRLYIGDEFCIHRLPNPAELDTLCQLAKEKNRALTFLTPPLTDAGIDRCRPLFDILKDMDHGSEVVVNDWV